jgi:transmembrane sensor
MSRAQEALDAAAMWLVRQEEPGWNAEAQAELNEWLDASDGNKAAYWRLKHGWGRADRIGALGMQAGPESARRFI